MCERIYTHIRERLTVSRRAFSGRLGRDVDLQDRAVPTERGHDVGGHRVKRKVAHDEAAAAASDCRGQHRVLPARGEGAQEKRRVQQQKGRGEARKARHSHSHNTYTCTQ